MTTTERQEIRNRYFRLSVNPPHNIGKDLEKAKAYDYDVAALLSALDELSRTNPPKLTRKARNNIKT